MLLFYVTQKLLYQSFVFSDNDNHVSFYDPVVIRSNVDPTS
jgi:hypothetical protein